MSAFWHPHRLRPGDRVRDYRIVRRLEGGGSSWVFLVERDGLPYTLKVAPGPSASADAGREAVSLDYLIHPDLVPVHERGRWPDPSTGCAFSVTEYVPGVTFHAWCHRERAAPVRWVDVLCEVLRPLEALHARGRVHGDFKADTVLVRDGDARPFLLDAGGDPEAHGEARPSEDLQAVGVLLYETLVGAPPLDAKRLADPRRLHPEAPASLCALALRLLLEEAGARPPDVGAVRAELRRLRAEEGDTRAWRTPGGASVAVARAPLVPSAREGGLLRALAVVLVLLVGMGWLGWAAGLGAEPAEEPGTRPAPPMDPQFMHPPQPQASPFGDQTGAPP